MREEYTCFFISPIKESESPERLNSDNVLNILLRPTLERCGFPEENVVRGDKDTGQSISGDTIRHLNDDDLCIADLTGLNPNVMYELGYRVGRGKPVIILIKKDEVNTLPFDVSSFRIVRYDLDSPNAILSLTNTQNELKARIMEWVGQGFVDPDGSGSVANINKRLADIEKKLDSVLIKAPYRSEAGTSSSDVINQTGSPLAAFAYALTRRDVALMEELLPKLRATHSKESYIDKMLAPVVAMGSEKAAKALKAEWEYIDCNLSPEQRCEELASYVSFCQKQDREPEEFNFVMDEAKKLLDVPNTNDEFRAHVYNQISRIYYGCYTTQKSRGETPDMGLLDQAIDALNKATALDSTKAGYFYNLAGAYHKRGNLEKAATAIQECLAISDDDSDHLTEAYRIYSEIGMAHEASEVLEKLQVKYPFMAELITTMPDVFM